jgi:hypothetical protein
MFLLLIVSVVPFIVRSCSCSCSFMFVSMFMFMFMFMFVFVFVFVFVSVFMLMFVFVFVFVFMFMFMFMRILMLMLSSCSKKTAGYPLCQTPSGDIPRGKTPSTLWRYPPFSPMHLLTLIIACARTQSKPTICEYHVPPCLP